MVRPPLREVTPVILPGATLGVMGGGQLGAMFAMAAKRLGYRVEALSDVADCPAVHHCDRVHVVPYDDAATLGRIATGLAAVTFEFENVPAEAARALAAVVPCRPAPDVLFTTQDRVREKAFLARHGFACAPHRVVRSRAELDAAIAAIGLPAVLKTAAFGYDGKGQRRIDAADAVAAAWDALGPAECVLEGWVDFDCEISVVAARGVAGDVAVYEPSRNAHAHHILDVSSAPAGLPRAVLTEARSVASRILEALDVVGVACVEFFVARSGALVVNEIAPRPHNSGHLTIAACETSQFEQQVRALCGLPLGSTRQLAPAAMANLLGDCWSGGEPDWPAALSVPGTSLLLYGKSDPRPGRKMGHLTALAPTADEAVANATRARDRACRRG
ncbi:MAG: 5-(carboxyamino)imidazole ribonucleotide synthase [Planctomycetia bacterium]|nr:5-(carboxyamino)imidazole ribonucleotide synthase [Planctomycetia bacterium]